MNYMNEQIEKEKNRVEDYFTALQFILIIV